ncbi:MAG TPA: aldehyde dehydrogenase family protein [Acidimicrobiales bacterium]|nr:aldehyde dehydrogenase family protein [Acidimicrobiales bacterium]
MIVRDALFIGGRWVRPDEGDGVIEVVNAATEEVMATVPDGGAADVDRAVAAAGAAFDEWSQASVDDRAKAVERLGQALGSRVPEVGTLVAQEVGMPLSMATVIQGALPAMVMSSYGPILRQAELEERIGSSVVVREAAGVVGAITPWNYPLHQAVAKVAPALAAGCTVVLKPSEVAPLSAFVLAEAAEEAGLPAGVLNVVTGRGRAAGEALVAHPGVDMVSFTGSTPAGRRVAALAAETVKRVTLELSGKSPSVVLDDADLPDAVGAAVRQCMLNSGQTCIAWSRLLVPRDRHDEAAELAAQVARSYVVGDPLHPSTTLGPLATAANRDRVRAAIRGGVEEGASLVAGGDERPAGLDRGFFVPPTVFAGVDNAMAVAREEVFGPVLAVVPYDGEDDAVRLANDSIYGLHAGVFSGDRERALRVARRLRAGQVDVNGGGFNMLAPFGGFKQSGYGRELGRHGLDAYLEVKSLQLP